MSVLRINDPANIKLPEEVGEKLGLKNGDVVSVVVEGNRAVIEKQTGSPVNDSFGIWAHIPDSAEYVNSLRDEWEERVNDLIKK